METSKPTKTLFIASEVRSGSTWVAELLAYSLDKHKVSAFGLTHEVFSGFCHTTTSDEVAAAFDALWRDASGVASAKIMCSSLSIICREAMNSPAVAERFFGPNVKWIVIHRENRISQAVSLAVARKTGRYHSYDPMGESLLPESTVSNEEVMSALLAVSLSDTFLETFSSRFPLANPLYRKYEEVMRGPNVFLLDAFEYCGFNFPLAESDSKLTKLKREFSLYKNNVANEFSSWMIKNYHSGSLKKVDEGQAVGGSSNGWRASPEDVSVEFSDLAERRLDAVVETHGLSEDEARAWCENNGVSLIDLELFRLKALNALKG